MTLNLPRKKQNTFASTDTAKMPKTLGATPKKANHTKLSKPTMIIVGNPISAQDVALELSSAGIKTKRVSYIKDLKAKAKGTEAGVIYVAPLKRSEILSVHERLRTQSKFKNMPFFAVVPSWVTGQKERQMYKAGIRMIFEWPKERESFTDLISTAALVGVDKVRDQDSDNALKKAISNRMSAEYGHFQPNFNATVYRSIVLLRGELSTAKQKKELVRKIRKIPGVRGVIDHSLGVVEAKIDLIDLKKRANAILEQTKGVTDKTMEVLVKPRTQHLVLTGTASSKEQVSEVKRRLEKIYGVSHVEDLVIVSAEDHRRDLKLARKAQSLVRREVSQTRNQIKVKIISGKAILKGNAYEKDQIQDLKSMIKDIPGVDGIRTSDISFLN